MPSTLFYKGRLSRAGNLKPRVSYTHDLKTRVGVWRVGARRRVTSEDNYDERPYWLWKSGIPDFSSAFASAGANANLRAQERASVSTRARQVCG
eukprot:3017269-Pleurochrysis_carterae.AAC.2